MHCLLFIYAHHVSKHAQMLDSGVPPYKLLQQFKRQTHAGGRLLLLDIWFCA